MWGVWVVEEVESAPLPFQTGEQHVLTHRCLPRLPPSLCTLPPAALHLAADTGQCDSVARLVALGAPVDVASNKGQTPLALALMKVRRRVVVRRGAELDVRMSGLDVSAVECGSKGRVCLVVQARSHLTHPSR